MLVSFNWSYYSFKKTGYYPFFTNNSSFNQAQLALALQEDFHKIYPFYSIDTIHNTKEIFLDKNRYGFDEIKNEWEFYDLFKVRNKQYLKDNFLRYLKDSFIKFATSSWFLFNVILSFIDIFFKLPPRHVIIVIVVAFIN